MDNVDELHDGFRLCACGRRALYKYYSYDDVKVLFVCESCAADVEGLGAEDGF